MYDNPEALEYLQTLTWFLPLLELTRLKTGNLIGWAGQEK